ncbi:hypothetical protein SD70_14280 [Gordoniibacillus kamchatkensis]|uniref:Uncharacterized protein n=1 Tax=Gordoniibacillus kamchatkensis TaxID=1590651 RepID=A0ABR5AHD8_9BACL|nr:hypothetical protein SD70_14280 [Paenibacillus sp. VKM B-2647]
MRVSYIVGLAFQLNFEYEPGGNTSSTADSFEANFAAQIFNYENSDGAPFEAVRAHFLVSGLKSASEKSLISVHGLYYNVQRHPFGANGRIRGEFFRPFIFVELIVVAVAPAG